MGIAKQDSFFGHLIEVWRPHHIIDTALTIDLRVDTGITPPVIGKEEQNVGRLWFRSYQPRIRANKQATKDRQEKSMFHDQDSQFG